MKKIAFLLAGILCSFGAIAQQIAFNEAVNAEIPKGAERITREQAQVHARKKFNNDKIVSRSVADITTKYIYRIDDVIVALYTFDTTAFKSKTGYVAEIKKGLDGMNKSNPTYSSNLQKINNNSIITINYTLGNVGYYHFYCYNDRVSREMTGLLYFDEADKDEATNILNHIIQSIRFKD